jgi:hypothetical protein
LARLKTRVSLQTRIGIATGLVIVGDLIGSGEAQERGIVGETPNLAARRIILFSAEKPPRRKPRLSQIRMQREYATT